jgi:parallel beta-helix repeat protein
MRMILLFIMALVINIPAQNSNYDYYYAKKERVFYVDNTGNDNNSGTSPGKPWKTISKVNAASFRPGDVILFKRGGSWREYLSINTNRLRYGAYGNGALPVISGDSTATGWVLYSGSVYRTAYSTAAAPRQVFINDIRGTKVNSTAEITGAGKWYWNSNYLYIHSADISAVISASLTGRPRCVNITSDDVTIENIQFQKSYNECINIASGADRVKIKGCTFISWTDEVNGQRGAVMVGGAYNVVSGCQFGKTTGQDSIDMNYSGFQGIYLTGSNAEIAYNRAYHNSVEYTTTTNFAYTAYWIRAGFPNNRLVGNTLIHDNYVYHTGGSGIAVNGFLDAGDNVRIYNNEIHYPGQAGVSVYQARAFTANNAGGQVLIYFNTISYANRLGGQPGSNGNRASGVHINDGTQGGVSTTQKFVKCKIFNNTISNSHTTDEPNSPDSDGIAIDYNANNAEIYKNYIFDCDGKGIYMYGSDSALVAYNYITGCAAGITVSTPASPETAIGNRILHNTCYQNNKANTHANVLFVAAEIFFAYRSTNSIIKGNLLYAGTGKHAIRMDTLGTSGNVVDSNLIYGASGAGANLCYSLGSARSLTSWRTLHSHDLNSLNTDPLFISTPGYLLTENTPAINRGARTDFTTDILGNPIVGTPDIGCFEVSGYNYTSLLPPSAVNVSVAYSNSNPALPRNNPFNGFWDVEGWGSYWMFPDPENYWLNNDWQLHMKQGVHGQVVANPSYDAVNYTPSCFKATIYRDSSYGNIAFTGTPRAELLWKKVNLQNNVNDTIEVKWKVFIPANMGTDYTGSTLAMDIFQLWHSKHLQIYGSKYAIDLQDQSLAYHRDTVSLGTWAADKGKWVEWKALFSCSYFDSSASGGGDTFFMLYKNDTLKYYDTYATLRNGNDEEASLKFGLYKPDWQSTTSLVNVVSIYVDEIRIRNITDGINYYNMDFGSSTAANNGGTTGDSLIKTITVSWPAVTGATSYEIYRSTQNNAGTASLVTTTANTTASDVVTGTTYYYWVKAKRSSVQSDYSNAALTTLY